MTLSYLFLIKFFLFIQFFTNPLSGVVVSDIDVVVLVVVVVVDNVVVVSSALQLTSAQLST